MTIWIFKILVSDNSKKEKIVKEISTFLKFCISPLLFSTNGVFLKAIFFDKELLE